MKLNMGMTSQLLASYTGQQFIKDLSWLVVILVSIAGALCTLYAVYIAYLFFTASDPTKRKAAKDRLIKVASSAIIIFALAGILRVLDVSFVTQSGSYTGSSGGNGGELGYSAYSYNGNPEMVLSGQWYQGKIEISGSFNLYTSDLLGDEIQVDKDGKNIEFKSCSFAVPKDWPGSGALKLDTTPVLKKEKDASGKDYTKFLIKLKQSAGPGTKVSIPVVDDELNTIVALVEFVYKNNINKSYTATVSIQLKTNTSTMIEFYKSV